MDHLIMIRWSVQDIADRCNRYCFIAVPKKITVMRVSTCIKI